MQVFRKKTRVEKSDGTTAFPGRFFGFALSLRRECQCRHCAGKHGYMRRQSLLVYRRDRMCQGKEGSSSSAVTPVVTYMLNKDRHRKPTMSTANQMGLREADRFGDGKRGYHGTGY